MKDDDKKGVEYDPLNDKCYNYYESSSDTVGKRVSLCEIEIILLDNDLLNLIDDLRATQDKQRRTTLLGHLPLIFKEGMSDLSEDVKALEKEGDLMFSRDTRIYIKGISKEEMDMLHDKHKAMMDSIKEQE